MKLSRKFSAGSLDPSEAAFSTSEPEALPIYALTLPNEDESDTTGSRRVILPKVVFFLFGIGAGSIQPFLPAYLLSANVEPADVGRYLALMPMAGLLGTTTWGWLASYCGSTKAVVAVGPMVASLFFVSLSLQMVQQNPFLISCVLFFGGFFVSAFQLLPALVMNSIQGSGEGFGAQKMYLSAAWALTSFFVGHLIDAFGLRAMFVVHITALFAFFCAVCSMAEARLGEKDAKASQQSIGSLIKRPEVAWLGIHLAVHAILLALINSFLGIYLLTVLGAPKSALGTAASINAISEFPMFFLADKLISKIGPENSLTVSTVSLALRLGVIGILPVAPWTLSVVLGLNLLHGLNLAVFQCAATTAADNLAPGNPMIHAINGALTQILGNACGSILWGKVWGRFGAQRTFLKAAEFALSWIVSWNAFGSFKSIASSKAKSVQMHDL